MAHTFIIPSIDGPFYYIQVNSILHTGKILYQDPPLTFYAFTLFTLAVRNTVVGVMVGSAVFAAAASVAVYLLFKHMFKSEVPAIAAALVCALSAEHIAMVSNVMKNSLGILFIVGSVFFLQRILDSDKQVKWNVAGAVGFFLLAMFTHVLDQGIVLLFMTFYLVLSLLFSERRKLFFRYGVIFAVAIVCSVAGFLLLPSFFGTFQKGLVFLSMVSASTGSATQLAAGGGAPAGASVTDPLIYGFLILGVVLSIYEFLRGDRRKFVLLASATAMGILLMLPFIPSDFAWRFQLMEFLPASIIIGYAFAKIKRRDLLVLAAFILIVPVAVVGFQSASALTPTISQQSYAGLVHMSTLVSTQNSVLLIEGGGMAYWPEYILNLPVVSNSSLWLQKGYTVYVLTGGQGLGGIQNGPNNGFSSGTAGPGTGNFGGPGALGQQGGMQGVPSGGASLGGGPQNQSFANQTYDLSNATVVYKGNSYTLYQLENSTK